MKTPWRLVGFMSLALSLQAAAPHPTLLTVKYKDRLFPVIKVAGSDPIILVDGKEKRLRNRCYFIPQRTEHYGDGFVQFLTKHLETIPDQVQMNGNISGAVALTAQVKSEKDLMGGYALVCVSLAVKSPDGDVLINSEFIVHDLPPLPAGQTKIVEFRVLHTGIVPHMEYHVQLFDAAGREVLTNMLDDAWSYYGVLEQAQLKQALANYRKQFAGQDRAAFPVVMPKPLLPAGSQPPIGITAILDVSEEGLVVGVKTETTSEPRMHQAIQQALEGWLFFPELKSGEPVACRVQIPVSF